MTSHDHHARNASPKFRSIKAVFEAPAPRPFSRSRPSSPANEAPNPVANLISREPTQYQQDNIDALLEAPSVRIQSTTPEQELRPKSSWIGPPPPAHLSSSHSSNAAMAHKVTVTYSSPGLQPPVYITTSLSEPQWDLLEMDCKRTPNGEHEFAKTFHAAEGEYQYKFRLGPGDWWVCDESKPTVADGFGARNNRLMVSGNVPIKKRAAEPQKSSANDGAVFDSPSVSHKRDHDERHETHHAPLLAHEKLEHPATKLGVPPENVPVTFSRQDTLSLGDDDNDGNDGDAEASRSSKSSNLSTEARPVVERIPTPSLDEDEDPADEAPLMRHETLSSPIDQAPLMRHETLSPTRGPHTPPATDHHHYGTLDSASSPTSSHSSAQLPGPDSHVPAEADPNDPSLIRFPTHHEGIISSLRRASLRNPDDEAKEEVMPSTSPITQSVSHSSQSPPLPSVREDEEELPEELEEEPQQENHSGAPESELDSLAAGLSNITGSSERPAALITPPGTPDESKTPHAATSQLSDHHHAPLAEKDMQEESEHDVSHHETQDQQQTKAGAEDGSKPDPEQKHNSAPKNAGGSSPKSSIFETVMGLGLFVVVGVGAAWMAFMMHDPIKDGGAALTGAS
jgi:hypothetical protein